MVTLFSIFFLSLVLLCVIVLNEFWFVSETDLVAEQNKEDYQDDAKDNISSPKDPSIRIYDVEVVRTLDH